MTQRPHSCPRQLSKRIPPPQLFLQEVHVSTLYLCTEVYLARVGVCEHGQVDDHLLVRHLVALRRLDHTVQHQHLQRRHTSTVSTGRSHDRLGILHMQDVYVYGPVRYLLRVFPSASPCRTTRTGRAARPESKTRSRTGRHKHPSDRPSGRLHILMCLRSNIPGSRICRGTGPSPPAARSAGLHTHRQQFRTCCSRY